MEITKELKDLVQYVWENREEGAHGWMYQDGHFITIEPVEDEEGDYLFVLETDEIDDLGYPSGRTLDYMFVEGD